MDIESIIREATTFYTRYTLAGIGVAILLELISYVIFNSFGLLKSHKLR